MNTLEERERRAYVEGAFSDAALLAIAIDLQLEVDELTPSCGTKSVAELEREVEELEDELFESEKTVDELRGKVAELEAELAQLKGQ